MSKKVKALVIIGGLVLAIGWAFYSSYLKYSLYMPEVGDRAPLFSLKDLKGQEISLQELLKEYNGVLINFLATWCPPCLDELPSLLDFAKELTGRNIALVFIAGDSPRKDVEKIVKKFSIKVPVLLDDTGKVGEKFGITGYPESFVINKQGILMKKFIGPQDWSSTPVKSAVIQAIFHGGLLERKRQD